MEEIQRADLEARRKAICIVAVTTVFGVCTILTFQYFQDDFQTWTEENIGYLIENASVVFLVTLAFMSPILTAGAYLFLFGDRIVRFQRFPPPNFPVSRDTRVLKGMKAIQRGRIIQLLSMLLFIAAGAIPFIMWVIFRSLGEAA